MSTLPADAQPSKPEALWRATSPSRTPQQIAQQFVDELYPGRQVVDFEGAWTSVMSVRDATFTGSFRLEDGTRVYKITCNRHGEYEVMV